MGDLSYSELIELETFDERLKYLNLKHLHYVSPRELSHKFYKSKYWTDLRHAIIVRDFGCDLGVMNVYIWDRPIVHHMNPIDKFDLEHMTKKVIDQNNLITTSLRTHELIHYRENDPIFVDRRPGDTKLW